MTLAAYVILLLFSISFAEHHIHSSLRLRHQILYRYLEYGRPKITSCPTDRFVIITEYQFGRTGNLMIELTNTLWISEKLNATLVLPAYMSQVAHGFDTHLLASRFCFVSSDKDVPKTAQIIEIESEESYFIFRMYRKPEFSNHLPNMTVAVQELSSYFLNIYAGFWCCPHKSILSAAQYIMTHHLGGNFDYVTVHKRMLEGGCAKVLAYVTKPSDYPANQIAMDHPMWKGNLNRAHPVCEMPYDLVKGSMDLNGRNNSMLYVAYDGHGDISVFKQHQAVFVDVLQETTYKDVDKKLIDMLVAMHGSLFIQNPRSTYSWQIMLIRMLLALPSVPTIRNNDFYLQRIPEDLELEKRILWVSYSSVMDVLLGHHPIS